MSRLAVGQLPACVFGGSSRHSEGNQARTQSGRRNWTPRELRHSFVSLLSDSGILVNNDAMGQRRVIHDGWMRVI